MSKLKITDFFLYRWRYQIGYIVATVILLLLLMISVFYAPGELTQAEIDTAVISGELSLSSPSTLTTLNLPYHLLQRASLSLFGVSIFSIKLPSALLALLAAIGMTLLLRKWVRYNVAVLASLIAITNGQFIFFAQDGTPQILYILLPAWILLAATHFFRQEGKVWLWSLTLGLLVGISLHQPLGIYPVAALALVTLIHPRTRYLFKNIPKKQLLTASIPALLLIAPILYGVYLDTDLARSLIGVDFGQIDFSASLQQLVAYFLPIGPTAINGQMMPIFSFGALGLMLLGALRLIKAKFAARSYIVGLWAITLIPVLLVSPSDYSSMLFVPSLLLIAFGVGYLLQSWYGLFPKNPYARIGGLIPLATLVVALMFSGAERYVYSYQYNPEVMKHFSSDLPIIRGELNKNDNISRFLVSKNEAPFYQLFTRYDSLAAGIEVTTSLDDASRANFIATKKAADQIQNEADLDLNKIITSPRSTQADRFYRYKNSSN